jgi:DNA invertase Pin-like site-specific DNA recombinase
MSSRQCNSSAASGRRFLSATAETWGRSLQDLVGFLSEIHAAGVDLFLHQQGIDTTSPGGKAMFQMLGVFAEFERSIRCNALCQTSQTTSDFSTTV